MLRNDVYAAFTVGVVLMPQAIAYAALAEMPPEYGLYAALVPLPVHALLTSSRHVSVGPFALVSLLVAETVSAVIPPESLSSVDRRYTHAVMLCTFLAGIIHLFMAALHLEVIVTFLPNSVIEGFTSAAAILSALCLPCKLCRPAKRSCPMPRSDHMHFHFPHAYLPFLTSFGRAPCAAVAASQLKHLLGMPIERMQLPQKLWNVAHRLDEVNLQALALGLGSIGLVVAIRSANRRLCTRVPIPEMLVLLILIEVNMITGYVPLEVPVVGPVESGLPPPRLPLKWVLQNDLPMLTGLLWPACIVGLFSYIITMSIVKSMSLKFGYSVDANAELRALGAANVAGAFFSSMPISGSLSRSAIIVTTAGAECTPMHSVLTSLMVLVVVLYAMPLVSYVPFAVLASIVILAITSLVDLRRPFELYRSSMPNFGLWLVAFCTTLLFGVEWGISVSIVAALLLRVSSRLHGYPAGANGESQLF